MLGGGLVPGSVVLIGGDPGAGKSTLLLQVCTRLALAEREAVLYVTGEESLQQLAMRAKRLGAADSTVWTVAAETRAGEMVATHHQMNTIAQSVVVLDSIQVTADGV